VAQDPAKPYGNVEYADPGYQKDGKKRYPLDNETHIRAAWSYINQADNAAKYSAADLAKVKAKIQAAMKRIGADVSGRQNQDAGKMHNFSGNRGSDCQICGGKADNGLHHGIAKADQRNNELETVDLEGVEVLSIGGPVRAIGSPPEGDHWTTDQLRAMVNAAKDLGDELKAPARLGHRKIGESQAAALRVSPAVGWLENQRLSEDGSKLLADIRKVPAKFAELVKAGAFRTRSSELSRMTSQKTGKTYDYVVSGLAWLGDKLPAVQTLDDVVALYEGDNAERIVVDVEEQEGDDRAFEVIGRLLEMVEGEIVRAADTRTSMPETKFTDEQREAFQKATGLEAEKVTDERMIAAGLKAETDDGEGGDGDDGGEGGEGGSEEQARALEARVKTAEEAAAEAKKSADEANEKLRLNERAQFVESVIRDGKEPPARKAELETLYDKLGHEPAVKFYEHAKVDETLVREYGSDEEGTDDKPAEEQLQVENELEEVFPGFESDRKEKLERRLEAKV
jgi:hypothetical protein